MKDITIKNYQDVEYSGKWNERVYASKIGGCVRIYLDNEEAIVRKEELEKAGVDVEQKLKKRKYDYVLEDVKSLDAESRAGILNYLLHDHDAAQVFRRRRGIKLREMSNIYKMFRESTRIDFETGTKKILIDEGKDDE